MRELSTCDFCGDTAAGVYEVVPADVPGVDARRMVLCEACRDTLSDIVDPLLAAGRSGGTDSEPVDSAARSPTSEVDVEDAPATPQAQPETGDDSTAEATDTADSEDTDAEGVTIEASDADVADDPADADEATEVDEATDEDDAASADEPAGAEEPAVDDESPQYESEPVERPPAYGKVLRLVENRDAGIRRRDLEELATGAYELSAAEVDEAIEFALQHGAFEETDGGLRTVPE
jgi:hypothetical protein